MRTVKRLLCLANSRKLSGRCIAGKELVGDHPGGWIRPISDREHGEVSKYECQYEDGSDPRVLDIMDVPLLDPQPQSYQQENWLLDPGRYWAKVARASWSILQLFADAVSPLWINGYSSSNGVNDRIPLLHADKLTSSLRLVRIERLTLSVFAPGQAFGDSKRRVQARFPHAGSSYNLWVTDPDYERTYLAKPDGDYPLGECFLTVSLGEPYEGYCYKLVAAIIRRGRRV